MVDELKTLALTVAPELADATFYVIDIRDAGLTGETAGGFAINFLPTNAFDLPNWTGPGALVAVDIRSALLSTRPCYAEAILLHELAHLLPLPVGATAEFLRRDRSKSTAEEIRAAMAIEAKTPAELVDDVEKLHGPRWVRRAAHLTWRAVQAGCDVLPATVLSYDEWLSPLTKYWPPLLEQIVRMRDATFSEIDNEPIPSCVREQHAADVQRYHTIMAKEQAA